MLAICNFMGSGNGDLGGNPLRTGLVQLEYRCYIGSIPIFGTKFLNT